MGEIVLRDLQSVLRVRFGSELTVDDFRTWSFLKPGENYCSTILKVCASIREKKSAYSKELRLIAKMLPSLQFRRELFDGSHAIKKEIFFYDELFPAYRTLEMECGVEGEEILDILPKFYGARLSLKPEADAEVDEDAVILLENLKDAGFYVLNRKRGLDFNHAKLVVQSLAKFHATGISLKMKKPKFFAKVKHHSKPFVVEDLKGFIGTLVSCLEKASEKVPILYQYLENCKSCFNDILRHILEPPNETWSTIVHMDFWVNNFLFRKNSEGKVKDIKFVDFQNYMYAHSLSDLAFFLGISLMKDITDENFDLLLEIYYESLIRRLQKLDCDVTLFSKNEFYQQLKRMAKVEFGHCFMMLKILTHDPITENGLCSAEVEKLIVSEGTSPLYFERLQGLIMRWVKKGWL